MIKEELSGKNIYLFGAGKIGRATLEQLQMIKICGIMDNNKRILEINGQKIKTISPASVEPGEDNVVVVTVLDYEEVVSQLKAIGWRDDQIMISVSWKIPFENDPKKTGYEQLEYSPEQAEGLLADEKSRSLYRFIREVRGGAVHLYRYEDLKKICGETGYWADAEVPYLEECAVLDCGAYTGDSIEQIIGTLSPAKCTYYTLEPDAEAIACLLEEEEKWREKVIFINFDKGAWIKDDVLTFHYHSEDAASTLSENNNLIQGETGTIEVTAIDNIHIKEENIFIKMDIEGAEAAALRGAERTIKEKSPFLAICAYHRPDDLYMLPALMHELNPDYEIFLRGGLHYTYYAIDKKYKEPLG